MRGAVSILLLLIVPGASSAGATGDAWRFTDVTAVAGLAYTHGYTSRIGTMPQQVAGGVAAGDYDGDGWTDLYVVRGAMGRALLFRNRGNGTFEETGVSAGVASPDSLACGPLFFDFDGDARLDLFVGAIEGAPVRLYRNRGDGSFDDVTASSGLRAEVNTISATAADYDGDGHVDLFLAHWGSPFGDCHLWRNRGDGSFACAEDATGLRDLLGKGLDDWSFTANFADLNDDRAPDLLLASDFGTSSVLLQERGRFVRAQQPAIDDENGMGGTVGDYDGDGDLDWFVSSIWDPDGIAEGNWGLSGNRLYRNDGHGSFDAATDLAGVRRGYWGWAAAFADLDNDTDLDLVHVNGWPRGSPEFHRDPTVLFVSNGDGTFDERAFAHGLADSGQGRGLACFDFDRDGDLDLFVANNGGAPTLWRNDLPPGRHRLAVKLRGGTRNSEGLGARIHVTTSRGVQVREICAGNHYVSQDPAEAWFGLGGEAQATDVRVEWPDGRVSLKRDVSAGVLVLDHADASLGPTLEAASAWPNPSTGRVDLLFATSAWPGSAVWIVDSAGRVVRRLEALGRQTPWDGRDANGRVVPAGLYWARRQLGGERSSARIVRLP